jgi:hypothetical protein
MDGFGMNLEDAIIEAGLKQKIKMAQLYKPANHCKDNPDTGIEGDINNMAKAVIKDCALMATIYLPVEVFSRLENPIESIKGKIKADNIKVFAKEVSQGDKVYTRVLYTMIFDYKKPEEQTTEKPKNVMDVYGDYTKLVNRNTPQGRNKTYSFPDVVAVLEGLLL